MTHRPIRFARALSLALALSGALAIAHAQEDRVELRWLGTAATGTFDESAAEIVAHDPGSQRLFVVNAQSGQIDVIDIADPSAPRFLPTVQVGADGEVSNSVAVHDGLVAVAVQDAVKTDPGRVAFFDVDGTPLASVAVGALPDMLAFTPDGRRVVVANEGEPNDGYSVDPEGSVSIIDVVRTAAGLDLTVRTADFRAYDVGGSRHALLPDAVRVFGPGASVAQDLEPEYVAISADGRTAWVALQENNALAIVDLETARVVAIHALGFKDHRVAGAGLDASDRDGAIAIRPWPAYGMYMPDGIAVLDWQGATYVLSANEGDARDYETFSEEARVKDLVLDPTAFPNAEALQADERLGRLTVTTTLGDDDGDGRYEALYAFGARSFSVWTARGDLLFGSGDQFEQITAARIPAYFNANNDENGADTLESRSDNKGPEPEGVTVGFVDGVPFAFIVLERIGGVMIYDLTDPTAPTFAGYTNHRDFEADAESAAALDLGAESSIFIAAEDSPTGAPLLVVANEVSGTTSSFELVVRR
jgi:2',3'-cyclic-nucleotide 2'-phosphodiesterase / 3'-nucleotidase / 5'-nucleotidase